MWFVIGFAVGVPIGAIATFLLLAWAGVADEIEFTIDKQHKENNHGGLQRNR